MIIAVFEALGLLACLFTLVVGSRAFAAAGRVRRSTLLALVGLLAINHVANILEASGMQWADTFADQFSIMVPFLWGLFLLETGRGYLSARLAASDEQVRFFLESVPASVAWLDGETNLLGFSAAWKRTLPESATGKRLAELLPVELPRLSAAVVSCALGRGNCIEELTNESAANSDGQLRYFRWCVRSWTHPDRPTPGVLVLLEDVSAEVEAAERREMASAELARSQRMAHVGQLAAGAAHDFNNFLQVINGAIWELQDEPRYERVLVDIQHALDAAQEMTRSMLRFGRDEESPPQPLDLAALLRELRTPLASALGRRHQLELSVPGTGPVVVEGRALRLQQAVLNLAVNARDAMPLGGPIRIGLEVHADAAELSVRDTGSGMADEVRRRLFTPFFTTKGQRGSGLGLHVVQSVVEEQHGAISVETELGRGSTFRLRFPLSAAPEKRA